MCIADSSRGCEAQSRGRERGWAGWWLLEGIREAAFGMRRTAGSCRPADA